MEKILYRLHDMQEVVDYLEDNIEERDIVMLEEIAEINEKNKRLSKKVQQSLDSLTEKFK